MQETDLQMKDYREKSILINQLLCVSIESFLWELDLCLLRVDSLFLSLSPSCLLIVYFLCLIYRSRRKPDLMFQNY